MELEYDNIKLVKQFKLHFLIMVLNAKKHYTYHQQKENLRRAEFKRSQILVEIDSGKFNYAEHFPNSTRVKIFFANHMSRK